MSKKAVVLGDDLSALLAGLQYSRRGYQVEVYSPAALSVTLQQGRFLSPELSFWPADRDGEGDLRWLESLLEIDLKIRPIEAHPTAFIQDRQEPFVGFGDKKYRSIPAAAYFNKSHRFVMDCEESVVVERIKTLCQFPIHDYSVVTDVKHSDRGILSVQINGQTDVHGDIFILGQNPLDALQLLPPGTIPARLQARVGRAETFTQLCLDFAAPGLTSGAATGSLAVLLPSQNDLEPVIGEIRNSCGRFVAFMPSDRAEDRELVSALVRQMRKLIEKTLPQVGAEAVQKAALYVVPQAMGDFPLAEVLEHIKKTSDNAVLASPLWTFKYGLAATIATLRSSILETAAPHEFAEDEFAEA
jgi:hypothetical protein